MACSKFPSHEYFFHEGNIDQERLSSACLCIHTQRSVSIHTLAPFAAWGRCMYVWCQRSRRPQRGCVSQGVSCTASRKVTEKGKVNDRDGVVHQGRGLSFPIKRTRYWKVDSSLRQAQRFTESIKEQDFQRTRPHWILARITCQWPTIRVRFDSYYVVTVYYICIQIEYIHVNESNNICLYGNTKYTDITVNTVNIYKKVKLCLAFFSASKMYVCVHVCTNIYYINILYKQFFSQDGHNKGWHYSFPLAHAADGKVLL